MPDIGDRRARFALAGILLLACVLRVHNAWVAPALSGFDGPFHASYIGILHFEHRLPLPGEGWSTFHPPLYYVACAIIWGLLPSSVDPHTELFAMRLVNVTAGLAIGLAVHKIARLLVPRSPWTAVAAAAITLFLPMHIGPSSRLGNEMLAAMLSSVAVVLLLRCLREPDAIRRVLLLGCVLGLAALTKFSALIVLGVAGVALAVRGFGVHGARLEALRPAVVLGIAALLVSGAYFARNTYHYGTPIVMQTPIVAKFMERQGYGPPRSLGAYFSLQPDILVDPSDRAAKTRNAVWPITFATAWYDIHGVTLDLHSAWGLRFAHILFACGGAVSLFALVGLFSFASARVRFAVPVGGAALVVLGIVTLASYVGFTYRVATYSALKASYLSPALPTFAVFAALGMARVAAQGRAAAAAVGAFALLFVGSVTAIFWSGWLAPMAANPARFYVRGYADEPTWRVFEYFGLGPRPDAASADGNGTPARPDVVLITLDTTRADRLGAYGYPKATTPAIDAFAADALVFDRAWSTSSWTLPAHASMFTGLHPTSHGAHFARGTGTAELSRALDPQPERLRALIERMRANALREAAVTLAELLRDAGYATAAFAGGPWLASEFGLLQGYDTRDADVKELHGRRAAELTDRAIAWLGTVEAGTPVHLLVNYFDPHAPYDPPGDGRGAGAGTTKGDSVAKYDREIRYMDRHVGRLLETLRDIGRFDDALILLVGDHGELLGEYGAYGHAESLYEELVRVPLIVRFPGGREAGGREAAPFSLVDLLPLVAAETGIPLPAAVEGVRRGTRRWALAELRSNVAISEETGKPLGRDLTALIRWPWKLVLSEPGGAELFHLERMPREMSQVDDELTSDELAALLVEIRSELRAPADSVPAEASAERVRQLQALGYVE